MVVSEGAQGGVHRHMHYHFPFRVLVHIPDPSGSVLPSHHGRILFYGRGGAAFRELQFWSGYGHAPDSLPGGACQVLDDGRHGAGSFLLQLHHVHGWVVFSHSTRVHVFHNMY